MVTPVASTPPSSLRQRVRRFLDEDAATFAFTSTLGIGAFFARELHVLQASTSSSASTTRRLQFAVRKTLPMIPAVLASSAVGIVGIKLTLAAVQDMRRDYSRTSLLVAVPVFAAIMHAPGGPRLMAKSAVGYGGFILAVDYAAYHWHLFNARKLEPPLDDVRGDHTLHIDPHHHPLHDAVFDTHNFSGLGRDASTVLAPRLAPK